MRKKTAITLIVILILIAAAAAAVYYFFFRGRSTAPADKIYVQSVEALQSYGGYGNRYSGVVDTQKSSKTEFDPEKKLLELFVSVGDAVKVGDPLFSYDTESISLEIDQLNLEIDRLNKENENNNTQIELLQKDWEKLSDTDKLDYSAQIAELQADIAQNEYDIRTKQSEIRKKKSAIENATVFCEMDGTVKEIADVNEIISGTSLDEAGSPTNTFITIMADGDFRIKGTISEINIGEIFTGMEMLVRSRTDDSLTWKGTIAAIDTQNTETDSNPYAAYEMGSGEGTSKYAFYVELETTEGLMIGQHVTLEPFTENADTAKGIWLDGGWILTNESGEAYVWAAESDGAKLEKRAVKTGKYLEENDQSEIVSGLALTDYIAWPDDSCYEGAPTTSEYIISDDEIPADDGMPYEEEVMMEGEMPVDAQILPGEMIEGETFVQEEPAEISSD